MGWGKEEAQKAGLWAPHLHSMRQLCFPGFIYFLSVDDFVWCWWWKISAVTERLKSTDVIPVPIQCTNYLCNTHISSLSIFFLNTPCDMLLSSYKTSSIRDTLQFVREEDSQAPA